MIASAGKITMCGASKRWLRASLIMAPQLAMGARTPTPRKLSVDSARIAPAMRDGRLHEHRLQNIRQQVAEENARGRSAERARRKNVFHFLRLQNLRAGQARVAGPSGDDQRDNHFANSRTEKRREGDGEKNAGE